LPGIFYKVTRCIALIAALVFVSSLNAEQQDLGTVDQHLTLIGLSVPLGSLKSNMTVGLRPTKQLQADKRTKTMF
jgi:hypothetical protein